MRLIVAAGLLAQLGGCLWFVSVPVPGGTVSEEIACVHEGLVVGQKTTLDDGRIVTIKEIFGASKRCATVHAPVLAVIE